MRYWKRVGIIVASVGLFASSVAQGPGMGRGMQRGMMGDSTMGPMMGCGMMMGFAMPQKVIPAEDGGLYVVVGNKIIKYDKKLTIQNEVTIEVDTAAVNQLMQKMRGQCPMWKQQQSEENQPTGEEE